ncbi:alpha/beta hydrolase family protein [Ktedonospora formicarum]|uniref:Putative peptidase YuxL n=1 Tax=Ktedonospora formicarum TaxID=2778364 RepID=A0A8J3IDD7_9CHLR|nr:S9 family peptidase [Ktedonospora formicarum]GHO50014.1 putative peptidase YuxL [Ktedonospora formicarum]
MNDTPHPLTHDDLWTFPEMGRVALSPNGRQIVYVLSHKDKTSDTVLSNLYLLRLDEQGQADGESKRLTRSGKQNHTPVWSPDGGRLIFLSDREGGKTQIWLLDLDGGEARKLTNLAHGVSDIAWSPDGRWIALSSSAQSSDEDNVLTGSKTLDEATKKRQEEEEHYRLRTITSVWYRLDGRGSLEKRTHAFLMPAPQPGEASDQTVDPQQIKRLTTGDYDHLGLRWTPDSREISLIANRNENYDRTWVTDLWNIDIESGEMRRLTDGTLQISSWSWSPDGTQALVLGARDMSMEGVGIVRPLLIARSGGETRTLLADLDYDVAPVIGVRLGAPVPYQPRWSEDGKHVYLSISEHGRINLHRVDIEQDTHTPLTIGEQVCYYFELFPGEQSLLYAKSQPTHPWELYSLALRDGQPDKERRLTHTYDDLLASFTLTEPERIVYEGAGGEQVEGWLLRPSGYQEGTRYPLFLHIHGGPQSAFGVGMDPFLQYCAAQGFAVFYCNPHGSTSYGEAFVRQVEGDWGGWDYQDIMRGVDECIARGVADPERLVVSGYSYGGYMTMRIIGQTGRFKAAVPMAGVSNLASFIGTSDIGFWMAFQSKGYPWDEERADYYRDRSPVTHAGNVTTPTRIYHPESDLRCPISQSEEFYMALKLRGNVPVEFVRVPGHWHVGAEKPSLMLERWNVMLDWFRQHIEMRPEEYC